MNNVHSRNSKIEKNVNSRSAGGDEGSTHGHSPMPQEQNPELLQWRANVLLDEMMLGAIDIAAGDVTPAHALPSTQVDADRSHPTLATKNVSSKNGETEYATQTGNLNRFSDTSDRREVSYPTDSHRYDSHYYDADRIYNRSESYSQPRRQTNDVQQAQTYRTQPVDPAVENADERKSPHSSNGTEQWLFAAEQRYQQIAARQQANRRTTPAQEYDGWSMAHGEDTANTYRDPYVPVYDSDYSTTVNAHPAEPLSAQKSVGAVSANGAANPDSTKMTGSGRSTRKRLRSNLLPRMNLQDNQSIQQEIQLLQSGIETTLPINHEMRVRAQHLLQKAHAILMEDPARSAEMDYYLQQVRTIVQRGQETTRWSILYQTRLRAYLYGWLALSLLVIISRYVYTEPLTGWLAWLTASSSESLLVYNLVTIAIAFFFGALGGGAGALLNMVQHVRTGYGFFDRKYALRGLILPVIGALGGLVLCVLFGVLYLLLGLDPTLSVWFGLLPALIALAFGAGQEYFYGVRG